MGIYILLFYKFVRILDPEKFVSDHLEYCKSLGVLGKVLVAKEGINGSISGTHDQVEEYKNYLRSSPLFHDIVFKEDVGEAHPFTKMLVRVKKEIIAMKENVNMSKRGQHVSPKEFLEMYNNNEDMIVLDARNYYESKIGKFKNAMTPQIKSFRDFPNIVEGMKDDKDKKIVMYCTGGIRCEKASAYMIERGFENVFQLEGGIINFNQQFPDTVWEGKCFVFDKRLRTSDDSKEDAISNCLICNVKCDLYRNCRNVDCDNLVVMCVSCQEKMIGCCSDNCLAAFQRQCREKSVMKQSIKSG